MQRHSYCSTSGSPHRLGRLMLASPQISHIFNFARREQCQLLGGGQVRTSRGQAKPSTHCRARRHTTPSVPFSLCSFARTGVRSIKRPSQDASFPQPINFD